MKKTDIGGNGSTVLSNEVEVVSRVAKRSAETSKTDSSSSVDVSTTKSQKSKKVERKDRNSRRRTLVASYSTIVLLCTTKSQRRVEDGKGR